MQLHHLQAVIPEFTKQRLLIQVQKDPEWTAAGVRTLILDVHELQDSERALLARRS